MAMTQTEMKKVKLEEIEAKKLVRQVVKKKLGLDVEEDKINMLTWGLDEKEVNGVKITTPRELKFYFGCIQYTFTYKEGRLWMDDKLAMNKLTPERKERLKKIALHSNKTYDELVDMVMNPKLYGYTTETTEDIIQSFEEVLRNKVK